MRAEPGLAWRCPRCGGGMEPAGKALSCPACGFAAEPDGGVWRFAPGFDPEGFRPERRNHLSAIERTHFWFPPRRRLLEGMLRRCGGGEAAIDLGCGGGGFLSSLAAGFRRVVGVDAYADSLAEARRRAPEAVLLEADLRRVPLADGQFDLATALDVLEHVEPALALLGEARRLLRPEGWLLLSVPASPLLWSALDGAAGHRCRYTRRSLQAELEAAGFALAHWTHYQALLFPLLLLARRLPVRGLHRLERRPPGALSAVLGAVNGLEVRLFGNRRLPIGSSLCALARRRDG